MLLPNVAFTKVRNVTSFWFNNKPTVTHQGDVVAFSFALMEHDIDQTVK